jgi:hypothetical protein
VRVWLPWLVLGLALGCDDLDQFQTSSSQVFHGVVIGSGDEVTIDDPDAPPMATPASGSDESFIRQGFASYTELELTFDPELADTFLVRDAGGGNPPVPGTLHSYLCSSDQSPCAPDNQRQSYFDHAPLETFATLPHDALSQYTFPGGGRLRNYLFGARFQTDGAQRHAMVFLSLMESGKIEVRIIAPSVLDASGAELHSGLFGVFRLGKRKQP